MSAPLTRIFRSAEAVVAHQPEWLNEQAKARAHEMSTYYQDWGGFEKAENTLDLWSTRVERELTQGCDEFRKTLNKAREQITGKLNAPLLTRLRCTGGHVVGHSPNVARAMAGLPGVFQRWERSARPAAVTIYVNGTVSGAVDARDLVWRGVAALCLADLYEAAGYRVEIWQATRLRYDLLSTNVSKTFVLAKSAESPAIPDQLATIVMSPRFWRGVLHQRITPEHTTACSAGVEDVTAGDIEAAGLPPATITVPGNCLSADEAIKLINDTIKAFGLTQA